MEQLSIFENGIYNKETNTFIMTKPPKVTSKHFNINEIIAYMNKLGFRTTRDREIKPEQLTGGHGCDIYINGIKFFIYINKKDIRKIHNNPFRYNNEAYQIIRKIKRLAYGYILYTVKGKKNKKIVPIDKNGNKTGYINKFDANMIYGNIVFDNYDEALAHSNKLKLNNGIDCSVTSLANYWNKNIQI